ncbi:hypothetical protein [Glycomyces harbinensis]|uniref:Uncharacterized protein n=1 Tax=Glycomyces harbinensis TaxID=58114 RepID=A0A1G6XAR8_9ACTN|nr:hypothetical protein [Glycomyces harbinensis]SDD74923.1 hypothetical protein SAMN05216270_10753 [Glycomyces harbinensis]
MANSKHDAISEYMHRESSGQGNPGKRMVLNPRNGKFELVSESEALDPDLAPVTAEDMKSFGGARVR